MNCGPDVDVGLSVFLFAPQDASLIIVPTSGVDIDLTKGSVKDLNTGYIKGSMGTMGGHNIHESWRYKSNEIDSGQFDQNGKLGGHYGHLVNSGVSADSRYVQDASFLHNWQTNGRYLHKVIV